MSEETHDFKPGDRVHYIGKKNSHVNGIVKRVEGELIFVVYYCAGDWDNYFNYTAQLTDMRTLKHGWNDEPSNPLFNDLFSQRDNDQK